MTDDAAEALARQFHERYESLAPSYNYQTREASAKPWDSVPPENKALMIETCRPIADEIERLRSTIQLDKWVLQESADEIERLRERYDDLHEQFERLREERQPLMHSHGIAITKLQEQYETIQLLRKALE